jgi:hypothetical protein
MSLAPGIFALACVDWAPAGWFAVGAVFAAAGCVMPLAVRIRPPAFLAAAEAEAGSAAPVAVAEVPAV